RRIQFAPTRRETARMDCTAHVCADCFTTHACTLAARGRARNRRWRRRCRGRCPRGSSRVDAITVSGFLPHLLFAGRAGVANEPPPGVLKSMRTPPDGNTTKAPLLIEYDGAVETVVINDHPRNRMSLDFMDALEAEIARVAGDPGVRAIVIRGAGS